MRAADPGAAAALLQSPLASLRTYVADVCLMVPAEAVTIAGWEAFAGRAATRYGRISAIAIDICAEGDAVEVTGRPEQRLASVCCDEGCGLDVADGDPQALATMLCEGQGTAWNTLFADGDLILATRGLAPILAALRKHPVRPWTQTASEEDLRENLASWLAERLRHLRIHQALQAALANYRLPGGVPVIVATRAVTPCLAAVYTPATIVQSCTAETAPRREERVTVTGSQPEREPELRRGLIDALAERSDTADLARMLQTSPPCRAPLAVPAPAETRTSVRADPMLSTAAEADSSCRAAGPFLARRGMVGFGRRSH